MQIIDCDKNEYLDLKAGVSIALGNFDGLHEGHMALIRRTRIRSEENGLLSAVLLFKNHTLFELKHESMQLLTSVEDKLTLLEEAGVDLVFLQSFDRDFCSLSKDAFIEDILVNRLQAKSIVVGGDFSFGKMAQGHVKDLVEKQEEYHYLLDVLDDVRYQNERISSTRIRNAVRLGRVEEAMDMLNRPYRLKGTVVPGASRGNKLGYRTANLAMDHNYVLPADGVYLTRVYIGRDRGEYFYGMTNIGTNPTFEEGKEIKIETHIFDFDCDIYGKKIFLDFLAFERGDIKFDSAQALIEQIEEDEKVLRSWISRFER